MAKVFQFLILFLFNYFKVTTNQFFIIFNGHHECSSPSFKYFSV
ncbi:hypothetical protein CHCC20331_0916 [Bacillus paralicheniformis]|nr:hypothetical protein CHCC20372_3779 [Bacillus paralicheniformis]TWK85763.1 hypothetical protein CHCC20331_0916 [Bacillus paralicheniformis]